jgi:delta24(24(1))-sterol reductase
LSRSIADPRLSCRKPAKPGFVATPGRKKYTRKSIIPSLDGTDEYDSTTPEPLSENDGNGNGYATGYANGHVDDTNGYAKGAALKAELGATIKAEKAEKAHIKELDNPAIDTSNKTEFGGSFGVGAMMIGFPALMYYMWIGAFFYDGKFPTPAQGQSYGDFFAHLVNLVKTEAYPSHRAWSIYWYFGLVQMAFYMLLPGVYRKGKPLPHLNGKQLTYYCSAMWSFYTSIALALVLHFTGVFKLYTLIDQFGPIMSVAILSGFLCSVIAYVSAYARGATLRMSGYPLYDFFLGSELNPRLFGILDFKMFLEVRIPWFILFFLALGTCLRQYEMYGKVSGEACFLLLAQYLYAGACSKGEHLIITTWYAHIILPHFYHITNRW